MEKLSAKKNFAIQIIYQILILGVPLIMAPLLTRRLGSEPLGIYSYTNSIAYYFVCLANLGISYHGNRTIAANRDGDNLKTKFWNLYALHTAFSVVSAAVYLLLMVFVQEDKTIFWIQLIYIVSALFDVTWLFHGLENFKVVVLRNAIVKIAEVVLIVCLVKTPDDLPLYTVIMCGSIFLGQVVTFLSAWRRVPFVKPTWKEMRCHIKPIIVLSLATFAYALYTMIDKTFLGILGEKAEVALYDYSEKLAKMPNTIITSLGVVMLPRMSKLNKEKNEKQIQINIEKSMLLTSFMSGGAMFGLAGIATVLAPVYYGEEFSVCGEYIMLLCPLILIVCFGNVIRSQYLIPRGRDGQYITSLLAGAGINILLNLILIPRLGIYGAIIGTLSAELIALILQMIAVRRELKLFRYILNGIPFLCFGSGMFFLVYHIGKVLPACISTIVIQIAIGAFVYCLISILYILIFRKDIRNSLLRKMKKFRSKKEPSPVQDSTEEK